MTANPDIERLRMWREATEAIRKRDEAKRVLRDYADALIEMHARAESAEAALDAANNRVKAAEEHSLKYAAAADAANERADAAERERNEALRDVETVGEDLDEAHRWLEQTLAALRGLLEDDELCRYPPDGDTCFCSSCKRIREARAALAAVPERQDAADTEEE